MAYCQLFTVANVLIIVISSRAGINFKKLTLVVAVFLNFQIAIGRLHIVS